MRALLSATCLAAASLAGSSATPLSAQERAARPDQVMVRHPRTGAVQTTSGIIEANSLDKLKLTGRNGKEETFDALLVQRVQFGEVPAAFTEAQNYLDRGDYANAAASFSAAAGDDQTRDVVRAAARLRAAETLLLEGATDPSAFDQAASEAGRFIGDHPNNRELPQARMTQARAHHLAGRPAEAAALYRTLYQEASGSSATAGYPLELCYQAGVRAAQAYIEANDVSQGRELYKAVAGALPAVVAEVSDETSAALQVLQAQAVLGEGFSMLAEGRASNARAFFESQISAGADAGSALRYGARHGLAEALFVEGRFREAQLEFAAVSGLDHTDRDRVARCLLGMARCSLSLGESNATSQARKWLEALRDHHGDTPSGPEALEMLKNL